MARISETKLREKMVYLIRKYRPFSLIGFDPDAAGEENLDHVVSAWAMAEASWTCAFDKHYPSHLRKGLMPAFVAERLLYSRYATNANCVVDISESIDIKIRALQAQKTMMAHIFYQYEKMAELCSLRLPYDHRVSIDDKVSLFFRSTAEKEGLAHKYRYAESMRRVFAGGPVQSLGATND
jgi:LmbE family N-acetylglucosaminyl deacetylase